MQRIRNRIYLIPLLMFLVVGLMFQWATAPIATTKANQARDYDVKIHYIDVGQGDCSFIELPDGKTMLIDAGQKKYGKSVVKYIKKLGYKKIDYVVATHADGDHIGGLSKVIEEFEVAVVYRPFTVSNCVSVKGFEDELLNIFKNDTVVFSTESSEDYALFLKSAYNEVCEDKLCEIRICSDKEVVVSEDSNAPYMIKFFMPFGISSFTTSRIANGYTTLKQSDNNETSAVVELISSNHKYLFAGDMTESGETLLLESLSSMEAELLASVSVLKVAHHGSSGSSTDEFLALTRPLNSVIMVGKDNGYGLPDTAVIENLENVGSTVYRTDKLGSIIIEEKNGVLYFSNIETKTILEKYSWIFYTLIAIVVIGLIVIIKVYPKITKKVALKKERKKSLTQTVDKKEL